MEVTFLNSHLEDYLASLEKPTVSKITKLFDMLEAFGKELKMPYSKRIGNNLYELRVRGQQEVRILYCFYNQTAVVVHAFIKKSQKTPVHEINTAIARIKLLTER